MEATDDGVLYVFVEFLGLVSSLLHTYGQNSSCARRKRDMLYISLNQHDD